jgi:hypothetical protein
MEINQAQIKKRRGIKEKTRRSSAKARING